MKLIRLLLPILFAGLWSHGASAADVEALEPAQEVFFLQLRTAIHGGDIRQLMQLTHPLAKECTMYEDREDYYKELLQGLVLVLGRQQTVQEIGHRKVDAQDFQQETAADGQPATRWPVIPEEQLIVRYEKEKVDPTAAIYIARDQDQWKWVHVCIP